MSDRHQTMTVILDKEYRDDDVQRIVEAVQMVKGVREVKLGKVLDIESYTARATVLRDFISDLYKVLSTAMVGDTKKWQQIKAILDQKD